MNVQDAEEQKVIDAALAARERRNLKLRSQQLRLTEELSKIRYVIHPGIKNNNGDLVYYSYTDLVRLFSLPFVECISVGRRDLTPFLPSSVKYIRP